MSKKRGCGERVQGAAYLEVPTSEHGKPVEYFLVDPPYAIDKDAVGLSAIGVTLFPASNGREVQPGVPLMHVLDWIGSQHYPNVADFVEEVKRMGVSRRISKTADFRGLGPGSRLFCVHSRALITNTADHYEYLRGPLHIDGPGCPKQLDEHRPPAADEMCAGLWWYDIEGAQAEKKVLAVPGGKDEAVDTGRMLRTIADVRYECWPDGVKSSYELACFAIFPLAQIAVIKARDGSHEVTEHAAGQSSLPVTLEDE